MLNLRDPIEDEVVVYCERTERMHCLDLQASAVWALCDGSRDLNTIVDEAAQVFSANAQTIRAGVEAAVEQFWQMGILA